MCTHRSYQVNTYYIYSLQGRNHYDHTPLNGSISCYDSLIVKYLKYIFVSIATPDIYIAPNSYMLPWRHRAINNTLWPRQDDCHFADDIFKFIFLSENVWVSLKIHWSLFLRFELTMFHHRFREWPGADPAASHYLNQWWLVYWCIYASLGLSELTQGSLRVSAQPMRDDITL